jgi:ABC-type sugar transport system permease subunit
MVLFLPVAATMAAMAVVWRFIFDTNFGILNDILGLFGIRERAWLTSDSTAMTAVILVGIWSNVGYAMVFFWAGLSNIPVELYEAAELDGGTPVRNFFYITWPLLSPTTLFVIIIITVRAVNSFDIVKVLTNGGPVKSTQVLSHFLYQNGFQFFDTGYTSGIAIIFFLIILLITWLQMLLEKWVHYN